MENLLVNGNSVFRYEEGKYSVKPYVEHINGKDIEYKCSCTTSTIPLLYEKQVLSETDMEIIKVIYNYHYLNYHNIAYYINNLSDCPKKESYEVNLRRLRKNGIVILLKHEKSATANCYILSNNAAKYVASTFKKKYFTPKDDSIFIPNIKDTSKDMSINQFTMYCSVGHGLLRTEKNKKITEYKCKLDLLLTFSAKNTLFRDNYTCLAVMCVRRYPGWEDYVISRLMSYLKCISLLEKATPVIVILAEDYSHMIEIAQVFVKNGTHELLENVLLTNDTRVYGSELEYFDIFDRFYGIRVLDGKKKVELVSKKLVVK